MCPTFCDLMDCNLPGSPDHGIPWQEYWISSSSQILVKVKWNEVAQLCPTVWPHRRQATRLPRPWDSPGKNTGVGCHFLLQCMKVKSESEVAQSCPSRSDPWTAAHQAPPSMGFSRQEYWSGVPSPSPNLPIVVFKRWKSRSTILLVN